VPHDPLVNVRHAAALVDGLARSGVRHVVLAPGRRSAPLAVAFAQHPRLREWVVTDERAAGFFALGMARELREPVAIACTSGTAVGNLLPAVIEADLSEVPLVLVTADRPPELRDVGAAQTIRQTGIFDAHARWSADLSPPTSDVDLVRAWERFACRAVATARGPRPGPVHLNVPFREPLVPGGDLPVLRFDDEEAPPLRHLPASMEPTADAATLLAGDLASHERGVIVCGPRAGIREAASLAELARTLGWPILADPLSDLRFRVPVDVQADAYDLLLRDPDHRRALAPTAILRFGGMPVSKALTQAMEEPSIATHVVVTVAGVWPDPLHAATVMVHADADAVVAAMQARMGSVGRSHAWLESWTSRSRRVRRALATRLAGETRIFEGKIVTDTLAALPDDAVLHVGNSMPVRDLDTFAAAELRDVRVACNRGANGIDGVVSAALGAAAVSRRPVALVVGDLSFLHDAGALQIAARHRIDATIVVVSNDGGGVFSFMPEAGYGDVFERCFGTPHGLDLAAIAGACGAAVERVERMEALEAVVASACRRPGISVIEVPSSRVANVALHREYVAVATDALEPSRERISA